MKLVDYRENHELKIQVGDIIKVDGELAILTHKDTPVYIEGGGWETYNLEFPYAMISLNTGLELNAYRLLETISRDEDIKFVAKNEDTELIIR